MPALFQDDGDDDLPGPGDLELGDGEGSLEVEDQPEDKGPIGAVPGFIQKRLQVQAVGAPAAREPRRSVIQSGKVVLHLDLERRRHRYFSRRLLVFSHALRRRDGDVGGCIPLVTMTSKGTRSNAAP